MAAEQSDEAAQPQAPRILAKAARLAIYFALAFVFGPIGFIVVADAYDLSAASISAVLGWLALLILAAPIGLLILQGRRPHYLIFGLAVLAASAALTFFKGRQEEERIARELQGEWIYWDGEGAMRSWVIGTNSMARFHEEPPLLVVLQDPGWQPYIFLQMGNSHICPDEDRQLRVEMIFDGGPIRHAIGTVPDITSYLNFDQDRLWIALLNESRLLRMRFKDGCGETRHLEFVTRGQTRF